MIHRKIQMSMGWFGRPICKAYSNDNGMYCFVLKLRMFPNPSRRPNTLSSPRYLAVALATLTTWTRCPLPRLLSLRLTVRHSTVICSIVHETWRRECYIIVQSMSQLNYTKKSGLGLGRKYIHIAPSSGHPL